MEWKTVKLGEIAIVKGGKRLPKGVALIDKPNQHPYIRIRDIGSSKFIKLNESFQYVDDETQKSISRYITNTNDILLSIVGTIGLVGIVDISLNNANQTENCVKIKVLDTIVRDFLYYYLLSDYGQKEIKKGTVGAVQAKLPLKNILNISLPLPPLETQRRIAAILSSLDDKIENNNRINRNLEAQAQALFKSWFVDFEPWGGVMPEDWREGTLGEIADITSGKRPPMREATISRDAIIPIIGAADVIGYTNDTLYETRILVTGRVGTHGVVQRFDDKCWPSDNTLVIESNWYEYTYQVMGKIDFHNMNRGSTQPLITQTDLKNQKIVIPSTKVLDDYECMVGTLFRRISNNQRESQKLATLRDTLLPKLMKGEIAV